MDANDHDIDRWWNRPIIKENLLCFRKQVWLIRSKNEEVPKLWLVNFVMNNIPSTAEIKYEEHIPRLIQKHVNYHMKQVPFRNWTPSQC